MGAFRPDGLVFTRPCKIFQTKVFREKKLEDKRIHDKLILLRVTFSIIVLESLRRIARWVVFAVYIFLLQTCLHQTITPTILETPPAPRGSGRRDIIIAILGPLAIRSYTPHAFEGIYFILCYVIL